MDHGLSLNSGNLELVSRVPFFGGFFSSGREPVPRKGYSGGGLLQSFLVGNVSRPRGDLGGYVASLGFIDGKPDPGVGLSTDLSRGFSRGLGFGRCGGGLSRWTFVLRQSTRPVELGCRGCPSRCGFSSCGSVGEGRGALALRRSSRLLELIRYWGGLWPPKILREP